MSRIGGSGWVSDAQRQWQPTLTVHEVGTTLSLESPLGDQPYQTGVRSRRPFTGVIFGRGREGAVVTAAKAMAFAIVTLVADRQAVARTRDAHVITQRAPVVACTPVTLDTVANSSTASGNTVTFSHTNSGNYLVVLASAYFASGVVTGVTYDGVAMTQIGTYSATDPCQSIWGLANPSTGAHNVVATFAGSPLVGLVASMSFFDASGVGTFAANAGSGVTSLTVTSPDTDSRGIIVAVVSDYNGAPVTAVTGTVQANHTNNTLATTQSGSAAANVFTFSADTATASCVLVKPMPCGAVATGAKPQTVVLAPRTKRALPDVTFKRNPAVDGNSRPKASQSTVVGAQQRRRRTAEAVFLRNPQAPAAAPAAKAMPFTIVTQYAVQRARLTARPTGEVAQTPTPDRIVKPVVVSQVGSRRQSVRRPGRAIFRRDNPASFDDNGSVPITVVVQQSRQFFRRPVVHVVFQRNPVQIPAAPAAKAPPFVVVSLVPESREAAQRRQPGYRFVRNPQLPPNPNQPKVFGIIPERQPLTVRRKPGFIYVRNPQLPPNPVQPKVFGIIPERQPVSVHRKGYVRFVRNPQPQIYTKAVPPVIVSLVPERRPLKPYRYARTTFIHNPPPPPGPVGPPDWIYRLNHRNPYPKLTLRLPYINVSARKAAPKLTKRESSPKLSPRRITYKEEKR